MAKSNRQYAAALYHITKEANPTEMSEAVLAFLSLLQKDCRLKKIDYIIDEFIKYAKKQEGTQEIEVESARKLSDEMISKIKKIFGDNSSITTSVNKNLIGGVRVKVNDTVLDASVASQIKRLKKSLQ